MESINIHERNAYWRSYPLGDNSGVLYHLAGADKNVSTQSGEIDNSILLYYVYRFALEEKIIAWIVKTFSSGRERALDCGCGTARNAVTLKKFFTHVDAFDIAPQFILENKKRFVSINFIESDFANFNTNAKYDLIFVGGVFMYMTDQEITAALAKIKKFIKPNGIIVLRDTITRAQTKPSGTVKVYRSEQDYENLLEGYRIIWRGNGATRNLWCSFFQRLPREWLKQKFILQLFQFFIRCTLPLDTMFITRRHFMRHSLSNQLFYVLKTS